ncbi:type 12 methyltransferase [Halomonas sp. HAL1]|uniref:acyltransferase n=1 Tax=Halomonas sp. HAL1 TaxID=550984 RepID=UPI00022D3253|nr:type 12 methyltransferase [Halomonas sp. HAL1]EHA13545.1 type 12 methyltransferase [Halomonas sp. HAL1]WKV94283.1 hypothetical protein Q3Y66_06585 [Halomonas sp. HAL1]
MSFNFIKLKKFFSISKAVSLFSLMPNNEKSQEKKKFTVIGDTTKNDIISSKAKLAKVDLDIVGVGNVFEIDVNSTVVAKISISGDSNKVFFEEGVVFRGRLIVRGNNQVVTIGKFSTFQSAYLLCQEGCNIEIGHWCMFSRDIEIRTTDAHSVVDVKSRERVNHPASVKIGNHVWVGVGSLISKGSEIPNDSIVGAYSFVNKKFTDENVLIAGTPAKIVRQGVTWNRGRKSKFSKAKLDHWKEPPSKTE